MTGRMRLCPFCRSGVQGAAAGLVRHMIEAHAATGASAEALAGCAVRVVDGRERLRQIAEEIQSLKQLWRAADRGELGLADAAARVAMRLWAEDLDALRRQLEILVLDPRLRSSFDWSAEFEVEAERAWLALQQRRSDERRAGRGGGHESTSDS